MASISSIFISMAPRWSLLIREPLTLEFEIATRSLIGSSVAYLSGKGTYPTPPTLQGLGAQRRLPLSSATLAFRLACDYRSRGCLIGAPLVYGGAKYIHPVVVRNQPGTLRTRYFHMVGMRYPPCIDTAGKGKVRKRTLHGCCRDSRSPACGTFLDVLSMRRITPSPRV